MLTGGVAGRVLPPPRPAAGAAPPASSWLLVGLVALLVVVGVVNSTVSATEGAPLGGAGSGAGAPAVILAAGRGAGVGVGEPLPPKGTPCGDGSGASCGTVAVPRDYSDPAQGTLAIAWRLYRDVPGASWPTDRGAVSAVGTSVVDVAAVAGPDVGDALPLTHDVLVVDQRGWGSSEAVDCPFDHEPPLMVLACARQQSLWTGGSATTNTVKDLERVLAALQASGSASVPPHRALTIAEKTLR